MNSLATLYATEDARIQNSLSSPGAIDLLVIHDEKRHLSRQLEAFLSAVRNVNRLEVQNKLPWPLPKLGEFLLNLNPLHLTIGFYQVEGTLKRWEIEDSKPILTDGTQYWHGCAMLDLSHFAPRLAHLDFKAVYSTARKDLELIEPSGASKIATTSAEHVLISHFPDDVLVVPPTLTSAVIQAQEIFHRGMLWPARLPSTLSSLKINFLVSSTVGVLDLQECTSRFPLLHSFHIYSELPSWSLETLELPNTLTELTLAKMQHLPLHLFNPTDGTRSPLKLLPLMTLNLYAQMNLPNVADKQIVHLFDLALALPTCIQNLTLGGSNEYSTANPTNVVYANLPTTLKRLTLNCNAFQPLCLLNLGKVTSLSELSIKYSFKNSAKVVSSENGPALPQLKDIISSSAVPRHVLDLMDHTHLRFVPTNVKHLTLNGHVFKSLPLPIIDDLPSQLQFLSVPSCDHKWALTVRKRLPGCLLSLSKPINIWQGDWASTMQQEFFKFWRPHLDVWRFIDAAYRYYKGIGIFFDLAYDDGSVTKPFDDVESFTYRPAASHIKASFTQFKILKLAVPNVERLTIHQPLLLSWSTSASLMIKQIPLSVTELDICNLPVIPIELKYPIKLENLQRISSNAGYWLKGEVFNFGNFPNLTYLDAPKWAFNCKKLNCIANRDFSKLNATLIKIPSKEIVNFLTNCVTATTRSNMHVTLILDNEALLTGLSAEIASDYSQLRHLGWRSHTRIILNRLLTYQHLDASSSTSATTASQNFDNGPIVAVRAVGDFRNPAASLLQVSQYHYMEHY